MSSKQSTVDFIVDQVSTAGAVSAKKMFGEYGLFCDGKMVALVCDDKLYVKPTPLGREFVGACAEEPPYPGAKPCLLIAGEHWDDREWLSQLVKISASQLPAPKAKVSRKKAA